MTYNNKKILSLSFMIPPLIALLITGCANTVGPLNNAAISGNIEVAKLLVENGANVNAEDKNGKTPLYWAAANGNIEVAKLLIENGANVNKMTELGNTPLHSATANGNIEIVKLLIENGADVDKTSEGGKTPLHYAAFCSRNGCLEAAKFLIENGADVNKMTGGGKTPLHWAAIFGNIEVAKLLVKNGANVNAEDITGDTPLHIAKTKGYTNMINLLTGNDDNIRMAAKNRSTFLSDSETYDIVSSTGLTVAQRKGKVGQFSYDGTDFHFSGQSEGEIVLIGSIKTIKIRTGITKKEVMTMLNDAGIMVQKKSEDRWLIIKNKNSTGYEITLLFDGDILSHFIEIE